MVNSSFYIDVARPELIGILTSPPFKDVFCLLMFDLHCAEQCTVCAYEFNAKKAVFTFICCGKVHLCFYNEVEGLIRIFNWLIKMCRKTIVGTNHYSKQSILIIY